MPLRNTLRQSFDTHASVMPTAELNAVLRDVLNSVTGACILPLPDLTSRSRSPIPATSTRAIKSIGDARSIKADHPALLVSAMENTWSRAARRKRNNADMDVDAGAPLPSSPAEPALKCCIGWLSGTVREYHEGVATAGSHMATLEYDWVKGTDRALFESFFAHVSRKVGASIKSRLSIAT